MVERKTWWCEICTKEFEGAQAHSHVEIFLNTINIRNSGYVDQHYSDIARLGMCYDCLISGLERWQLYKLKDRVKDLQSGRLVMEQEEEESEQSTLDIVSKSKPRGNNKGLFLK